MLIKKLLAIAALLAATQAHAVVIACDPNATGSTTYPNVACSSAGQLQVSFGLGGQSVALTDGSGSITTGGTSQQIFAANATRQYLFIENLSSGNLYVNFGSAATQGSGSIMIVPNGSFVMENGTVSNQTVNIIGATSAQAFTAKQR
jgi:hypothetical protein